MSEAWRSLLICGLVIVASCLARCATAPVPEPLPGIGLDPEVVRVIEERRLRVLDDPADPPRWRELALAYQANGFYEQATGCWSKVVELGAADARAWRHFALARERLSDARGAIEAAGRATELAPEHSPAWQTLGRLQLAAGDLEGAELAFARALEVAPHDAGSSIGLARVDLRRGDAARAAARLEPLLASYADSVELHQALATAYRELGRAEDSRRELELAVGRPAPWPDPWDEELERFRVGYEARIAEARRAAQRADMATAIGLYEGLRRDWPDQPLVAQQLAECYLLAGRTADAERLLEEALASHPEDWRLCLGYANLHFVRGQFDPALAQIEKCLALNPEHVAAYVMEAAVHAHRGNAALAERALERAAGYAPPLAERWIELGQGQLRMGWREEAAASFERALRERPGDTEALALLASARTRAGRPEAEPAEEP